MSITKDGPIHGGTEDTASDTERWLRARIDGLERALRRIHDTTGPDDEGKPTSLGYIRRQAREALGPKDSRWVAPPLDKERQP